MDLHVRGTTCARLHAGAILHAGPERQNGPTWLAYRLLVLITVLSNREMRLSSPS
jgi:hypothetical protein